jgi:hypothetical protein
MSVSDHRSSVEKRALLERRTIELLTGELGAHVERVADRAVVSTYILAAMNDLRGSVCPDALPEMAARLVRHRLSSANSFPPILRP